MDEERFESLFGNPRKSKQLKQTRPLALSNSFKTEAHKKDLPSMGCCSPGDGTDTSQHGDESRVVIDEVL